jgi:hypothetical protein
MAAVGIGRGKTAQALNAATFLTLAMMTEIGVRRLSKEMIAALMGGKDLDPWDKTITGEAVSTALNQVPIVSNVVGSMEYGSNPVPAIALGNDIAKKLNYGMTVKDGDKKLKHFGGAALFGAGAFFGVPGVVQADQLLRKATDEKKGTKKGF